MNEEVVLDPVATVALLDEPNRRQLFDYVTQVGRPVGRDEASAALHMSRELAAFHLDRLVAGGLLQTEYRRLGDRRGPGAGRPSKLYRRSDRNLEVSFPPRRYERAAALFAAALARQAGGAKAAADVARTLGETAGAEERRRSEPGRDPRDSLFDLLREGGYQPRAEAGANEVCLGNCPYKSLARSHPDLTCRMNLAWAEGLIKGLAVRDVVPAYEPAPDRCCLVFRYPKDRS